MESYMNIILIIKISENLNIYLNLEKKIINI